jgi:hypothetical protein
MHGGHQLKHQQKLDYGIPTQSNMRIVAPFLNAYIDLELINFEISAVVSKTEWKFGFLFGQEKT